MKERCVNTFYYLRIKMKKPVIATFIDGGICIDKTDKLIYKALMIGVKYGQADKPTKIEVGKLMISKRRVHKRKKSKNAYR